nr:immunoglobulin light chain junction region [Macaca mulatta]MOX45827.1 immunoglobulin light chain junction region [Macaca mulatta]
EYYCQSYDSTLRALF